MGSSYSAQHSSSLLSTPGAFSSFHSMLGHWAVSHMAWLQLPSACWWLPDSYSFLDLHGQFLASRTCQRNVPQVLKVQHLPYSVSPHKLLSPQFLPSLVKLVNAMLMHTLSKELNPSYPRSFTLLCPLLSQASNSKFSSFLPPKSLWNPSLLLDLVTSISWTGICQLAFWLSTSNITFPALSVLLPLWTF